MKAVDLAGKRFGRLTVGSFVRVEKQKRIWSATCDCGAVLEARSESLASGNTTSCGCVRRDRAAGMKLRHGHARQAARTPEYRTWKGMINRCECPTSSAYMKYGAKGTRVCEAWRTSYEAFFRDVGPKPGPEYSIDRVDPYGHYEPGNVRWATAKQQANNKRKRGT
jgi:hypothetical protein